MFQSLLLLTHTSAGEELSAAADTGSHRTWHNGQQHILSCFATSCSARGSWCSQPAALQHAHTTLLPLPCGGSVALGVRV